MYAVNDIHFVLKQSFLCVGTKLLGGIMMKTPTTWLHHPTRWCSFAGVFTMDIAYF